MHRSNSLKIPIAYKKRKEGEIRIHWAVLRDGWITRDRFVTQYFVVSRSHNCNVCAYACTFIFFKFFELNVFVLHRISSELSYKFFFSIFSFFLFLFSKCQRRNLSVNTKQNVFISTSVRWRFIWFYFTARVPKKIFIADSIKCAYMYASNFCKLVFPTARLFDA